MYDSVASAKGDGDTRPGVKIRGMLPFAKIPTIDRRVPPPSSKQGIQKPPQTDPSKRRVMEKKMFSLSLYYSSPAQSPMEEYDNSYKSNENYALVAIVGIYGIDSPRSASKT